MESPDVTSQKLSKLKVLLQTAVREKRFQDAQDIQSQIDRLENVGSVPNPTSNNSTVKSQPCKRTALTSSESPEYAK